jgi:predicted dehydrogenase
MPTPLIDAMDTPIRVALIGYGFAGKTFHAPLIEATPGLALAVIASRDAAKVHRDRPAVDVIGDPLQAAADERVDLVVVATPNETHAPLARAALMNGKHLIVDKPFTLTLADARELQALATSKSLLLSVFQNRRWDSDYLGVQQAVAQGLVGEVSHFEAHFDRYRPQVRERWRESPGPGGGLWFDLGPHLIDQALQLLGLPDRVQANFASQRAGAQVNDWAHVLLDYGSRRAVLHAGMLVAGGTARFAVHGSKGSLIKRHADRQEAQLIAGLRPGESGWGEDPDPLLFYDGSGAEPRALPTPPGDQRRFYAAIRDALRGVGANPVPPQQALAVMGVLEAALESAATGKSVALPLTSQERAAWRR